MPSDNHDRSERNTSDQELNPFVAFRRFADDQIAAVFQVLSDLPAALNDLRERIDDAEAAALRSFEKSYERATNPERRQTETRDHGDPNSPIQYVEPRIADAWNRALQKCPGMRTESVPNSQAGSQEYTGAWSRALVDKENEDGRNTWRLVSHGAFDAFDRSCGWRPSIAYLASSRYSPLRLEQDEDLDEAGVDWRDAFEELLVEDASVQPSEGQAKERNFTSQSADEWVTSLLSRDLIDMPLSFPALSPLVASPILSLLGGFGETQRADSDGTELDHYERFFREQFQSAQTNGSGTTAQREVSKSLVGTADDSKPKITSTKTTTERRTTADGTVTTKTVTKKCFADGREESEETISTTHASLQPTRILGEAEENVVDDRRNDKLSGQHSKKDSWFWSS